jgi:hypothetical protein
MPEAKSPVCNDAEFSGLKAAAHPLRLRVAVIENRYPRRVREMGVSGTSGA